VTAFDANDAAHQAFRRGAYRVLGMADDPAMDPEPVIDLDAIDLTKESAEAEQEQVSTAIH